MAEPSERSKPVLAWRQKNRDEGLRSITAWMPAAVKYRLEELASQRRQTIGEVITDALNAMKPDTPLGSATQLQQLIKTEVERQLRRQHSTAETTDAPTPEPAKTTRQHPDDSERAAVQARILDLHERGWSNPKIAETLNSEGVPTFTGRGIWQQGTIGKLLRRM